MIIYILVLISFIFSNNFTNMPISLVQPNDEILECLISGDEYYQRLHDVNNYTIIQNPNNGYYYYADNVNGKILPSIYKANNINPIFTHLVPNIKISKENYLRIREEYWRDIEIRDAPSVGTINNLNVFIRFSDEEEFVDPRSQYDIPFNDPDGPSMKHYFNEVSYELLTVNTSHYPSCDPSTNLSYQDQFPRSYYKPYHETTNPDGYQNGNQSRIREHTLLKNAIEFIESDVPEDLIIDSNDDGYVDNVTFLVSGSPTGWSDLLWPHRWSLSSYNVYLNGSRVYDYNLNLDQGGYFTVGTLCHEFFHSLGAPDLYHYYDDTAPIAVGGWDVMDASNDTPQSMSAFMKYKYTDWITTLPEISYGGNYELNPLSSSENNIYRINSPLSSTEYFIVEYRVKEGLYEINTPGDDNGLLIYRVNTLYNGNANGPPDGLYLYRYGGTLTSNGSFGAATFSQDVSRTQFNDMTNPSCFLSDNSNGGVNISYVGEALETIEFSVTNLILVSELNTISYDSDNDGNINPGEEIIVDFSISNLSDGLNASNITATLSSNDDIIINNPIIEFNNTLLFNTIVQDSYVINIGENIALGDILLNLHITANYTENNEELFYQNSSNFTLNVNLLQSGFPYFTTSQISGAPSVADLNQNGENEIYFADYTGTIRSLDINGNEIETGIFPYETNNQIWGTSAVADIDNDGNLEIIFGSKDKKLYVFRYSELLFVYDAASWLIGTPAVGNIDDDDELEIIIGGFSSSGKKIYAINHDGSDVPNYPILIDEKIQKGVALFDFNNNSKDDIVFGTDDENIYLMHDDGTIAPGFPVNGDGKFRTDPIIVNYNNEPIIITASQEGTLYGVNADGSIRFEYTTNNEITTSPSIHTVNGQFNIVFGNLNGDIHKIDINGNSDANFPINIGNGIIGSILFADIDNNGQDEFIILDEAGFLTILESDLSYFQHTPIEYDFAFSSPPTIEDIDNDGDLEILAGTVNSLFVADFKNPSIINDSWNLFKGNYKRDGLYTSTSCFTGDFNNDNITDIIDIVALINTIFSGIEPTNNELCAGDFNDDGILNIQDIILLVNIILDNQ